MRTRWLGVWASVIGALLAVSGILYIVSARPKVAVEGEYYETDGFTGAVLIIYPNATFSLTEFTDLAVLPPITGTIQRQGPKLVLETEKTLFRTAKEFFPVQWWQRMYLVEPDRVDDFCAHRKIGYEPRVEIYGWYLLKDENWKLPAQDVPRLLDSTELCPAN